MTHDVCTALAECVRAYSREGRLFSTADLPEPARAAPDEWRHLVADAAAEHPDLRAVALADGGTGYFSERHMTGVYARILAARGGDPLPLIVETVREQSRLHPRPVPTAVFSEPPYDFSPQDLGACLERIATAPETADIARAVTSAGTTFLYSTRHLHPDHAAALAEWIDVGEAENP
jgi:hypothetical protein